MLQLPSSSSSSSSSLSSSTSKRPLIVLAGWLGSQPRHLRRYEQFYKSLGLDVVSHIATPRSVVKASRFTMPLQSEEASPPNSIQALSWKVFRDVQHRNCWFVHVFSNGGCFVWEHLRKLLIKEMETTIVTRPSGVIFDSSPANFQRRNDLDKALAYCTWKDRAAIRLESLWDRAVLNPTFQVDRARSYWECMLHDKWDVRQLYLCSHDDELCCFEDLRELVHYRQSVFGKDRILLKDWQSSHHCAHILDHPDDYRESVRSFIFTCMMDLKLRSSL